MKVTFANQINISPIKWQNNEFNHQHLSIFSSFSRLVYFVGFVKFQFWWFFSSSLDAVSNFLFDSHIIFRTKCWYGFSKFNSLSTFAINWRETRKKIANKKKQSEYSLLKWYNANVVKLGVEWNLQKFKF